MCVCCSWASVCGSSPSMVETLSTTGRPARSSCSARKTRRTSRGRVVHAGGSRTARRRRRARRIAACSARRRPATSARRPERTRWPATPCGRGTVPDTPRRLVSRIVLAAAAEVLKDQARRVLILPGVGGPLRKKLFRGDTLVVRRSGRQLCQQGPLHAAEADNIAARRRRGWRGRRGRDDDRGRKKRAVGGRSHEGNLRVASCSLSASGCGVVLRRDEAGVARAWKVHHKEKAAIAAAITAPNQGSRFCTGSAATASYRSSHLFRKG